MKVAIKITLTKDLEILCDIFCTTPEDLLQSFIDHVSLPRYMNCEKHILMEAASSFLILHEPLIEVDLLSATFCDEISHEVIPGPEAEDHIRQIVLSWHKANCSERSQR